MIDEEDILRLELMQRIGQKPTGELIYFAFHLPYLTCRDLTGVPLIQRREVLGQLVG
jgi:ATP-dependent DNA ligase